MKMISDRLWNAVVEVAKLRYPSMAEILRKRGFGYEADRMDELTAAFDEMAQILAQTDGDGGSPQSR
jgi:hypothetical protein